MYSWHVKTIQVEHKSVFYEYGVLTGYTIDQEHFG